MAVVNAGRTTKSDTFSFLGAVREDIQDNLAVDAQLHSLESYINPDVYDALRLHERHAGMLGSILEDSLFRHMTSEEEKEDSFQSALGSGAHGVALLQPVTTGIEFDRSCRSRFPTRRHLSLNIEPISTMISFEDLQLIESVLERWSSEQKDKGTVQDELNAGENLAQGAMSGKADAFGIARNGSATGITQTYEVVFESKELGLGLRKDGDSIVVDEVRDKSYRGIIETGDVLILIGGRKLRSTSLPTVVHQLEEEARPAKMTFTRLSNTASSLPTVPPSGLPSERIDDVEDPKKGELQTKTFTLRLKRGIPHGLTFERSSIGDVAVVARVDSSLSRAIAENQGSTTAPQCGALVIKVKEEDCSEMGYDKTMHLLHELSSSFASDAGDYTVTFFEAESAVWGSHDHFYVSVSGAVFTCIDDLNGRDMPLLRGNLEAVDVRFEQGLGTSTTILDSTKRSPSIIHTGSAKHHDTRCDSTITLTAFAKIAVDYFHPRISVYEPFVESAQLCVILERHNANERIGRPGEIALEISDRILREPLLASSPGRENKPQLMCVNFTDAFAGVFFRALREWTAWRKSVISRSEASAFEEFSVTESRTSASSCKTHLQPKQNLDAEVTPTKASSLGTELSSELGPDGSRTSKHVAAQNVAQAALLFAQKRGADTGAKSESSKPFVLKNRTGVSIAFVQQEHGKSSSDSLEAGVVGSSHLALVGEYNGLERIEGKEAIELADGEDEAFHMNLLSDESVSNNDAAKRVRTYEGKFPLLAIAIQAIAGVSVEPLRDLQVFKAGSLIRHLSVRKSEQNGDSQDSFDSEGYPRFSIPLVWKVEVEDNRRILTLSSAVRIATLGSAFGIEVGIRIQQEEGSGEVFLENEDVNVGSNDPIQMIGFAQLDTPFYLPLWLALKFVLVRVYVRPRTTSKIRYSWGHRAVLQFGPFGVTKSNDWVWQDTFNSLLGSIRCGSITHGAFPAFLSCYSFGLRNSKYEGVDQDLKSPALPGTENRQVLDEMLSVYVGSGLTLRNMLPADIEWETAHGGNPRHSEIIDGTTLRRQDSLNVSPMENFEIEDSSTVLKCGDLADVFACSFQTETLSARFRLKDQKEWSKWALVSLRPQKAENEDSESGENNEQAESTTLTTIRQVNVQVEDDFGVPITFGLRIIPKVAKASEGLRKDVVFGVDVIVFAELWIGNLTSLPLIFGCPGSQIHTDSDTEERKKPSDAHVKTKYSAEAALMEIASVLELGERGTGMDTRTADLVASAGEIYNIPHQEGNCIVEEIFEFLELEDSQVKRRWWATESYWNLRNDKILELPDDGKSWHWTDDAWKIDCSGHVSEVTGGWESCKDLLGGKEGPLAGQRSFCRSHPFRRRRWFRARATNSFDNDVEDSGHLQRAAYVNGKGATLLTGLQAFHHPVVDSFSMAKRKLKHRKKSRSQRVDKGTQESTDFKEGIEGDERSQKSKDDEIFKISVKVGDGRWSVPAPVSSSGTSRGIVKVFSSRWPNLTKALGTSKDLQETFKCSEFHQDNGKTPYCFDSAPLSPTLYELVYNVSEMEGEWGEFSRLMLVSARFSVRNDSSLYTMEIKQAGARDETAVTLSPGETSAFFWADFRLPQLVCIRPVVQKDGSQNIFKWSGGFDVCRLGMTALMLRHNFKGDDDALTQLRTIRSLSEIRPGTGGTGINLSFKEENTNGDGALFLIENNSMFNIWVAQDGVLANPSTTSPRASSAADGDLVRPGDQISFGLDVPYRQGKYAHRKAATMDELLRIRIGLAPLSSHAGIETTKVIGLANVGETVRLKPGKLITILNAKQRKSLENVRVLAVTTADGPSRVLKFRYVWSLVYDDCIPLCLL